MTHTAVSQANSALQLPTLEHVYALLKQIVNLTALTGVTDRCGAGILVESGKIAYRIWRNTVRHMSPVMKTVWGRI